jgi:hypothetical protein
MSSTLTRTRVCVDGKAESIDFVANAPVSYYLKALGVEVPQGSVPVVGGRVATVDTIVPEQAAVTVAPRPDNG